MNDTRTIVASFRKNQRETIQISLTTFKEHELVYTRIFVDGDDSPTATRKGITCSVRLLPQLIDGLRDAEVEARRRGLLDNGAARS